MKNRLIIYFNYHPNGQADAACRFAVQQMAAVGQVFFVNNGPLQPESRQWAQGCCHTVLERENTGFDVGAYRDAVLQIGLDMLLHYDEVIPSLAWHPESSCRNPLWKKRSGPPCILTRSPRRAPLHRCCFRTAPRGGMIFTLSSAQSAPAAGLWSGLWSREGSLPAPWALA